MTCLNTTPCLLTQGPAGDSGQLIATAINSVVDRGRQFSQMLNADVYVESDKSIYASNSHGLASNQPSGANQLTALIQQIQAVTMPSSSSATLHNSNYEQGHDFSLSSSSDSFHQDLLDLQMDLVRNSLVVNIVSAAKQSVTTILQQQG